MKPGLLSEGDVTRTVKDFLELRGWRPVRINAGPFGKSGMPDYLMVRYRNPCQVFWIEMKSSTGRLGPLQKQWMEEERLRGAVVVVCRDIDLFIGWYESTYGEEGQMRLGASV